MKRMSGSKFLNFTHEWFGYHAKAQRGKAAKNMIMQSNLKDKEIKPNHLVLLGPLAPWPLGSLASLRDIPDGEKDT